MRRVAVLSLIFVLGFGTIPALPQENDGPGIALVMKALSNPFFAKMEIGARQVAQDRNVHLEVFGVERETDVDSQIGIVENLITRGYKAIVIAPADSKKLIPICQKARKRGLIVINIDNPLHRDTLTALGLRIPFVGSDNSEGAGMVGDYVKRKLGGKGRAIVIEGIRGVENAELRKSGFTKAVTAGSSITVVASESANWHTDEAFALVTRLLEQHKKIDAIFCANDSMALGALQALDMQDLTGKVILAGYDNLDTVRNEMRNQRIHATVEQHPELMGAYGVELALRALEGRDIPDYRTTDLDIITYEGFGRKVALSICTERGFFVPLVRSAHKYADLFGMKLLVANANDDNAQQLVDIQKLIKQKVDVMLICPTNSEAIQPAIELINEAGIPVITVDRKSSGGKVACHIASDNLAGGRMAAKFIADRLHGQGRILEIDGIPGTSADHDRGVGFNEAIKSHPGIKIVGREVGHFDRVKAREAMEQVLKKNTTFDAIFAHNDSMILGVLEALSAAPPTKRPILVGFDAIPEAVSAIREKKLDATIAQQPETMGKLAAQSAVKLLRGETLPPKIAVRLELISR